MSFCHLRRTGIEVRYILRGEWPHCPVLHYWQNNWGGDSGLHSQCYWNWNSTPSSLRLWWNALQIKMRQSKDICGLPLTDYTSTMSQINKKDRQGIFQFIYFILWWGTLVQESQLDVAKWRAFTIDITACCEAMLKGRKLLEVPAKKWLTVECKGGTKHTWTT